MLIALFLNGIPLVEKVRKQVPRSKYKKADCHNYAEMCLLGPKIVILTFLHTSS